MKYAILLAFAVFAFLAQADAKVALFVPPEIEDRGAVAQYFKEKLAAAKEKLEEMLSKAQNALKEKINEAKNKAEHLIEQLKQTADKISDKVFEAVNNILDKLEAGVAESTPQESQNIESISECMVMQDNFRQAVLSVIVNSSSCVTDKIVEAQSYVMDVYTQSTRAVGAIIEVKEKGIECVADINKVKKIIAATTCVTKVTIKGGLVIGQTVTAVTIDVAKLINEIATLQSSLSICIPTKALITLAQQVQPVVVGITNCIQEKIEEATASKKSSQEQITEEESRNEVVEEESQNEVIKDEHPELQSRIQSQDGCDSFEESVPMVSQE